MWQLEQFAVDGCVKVDGVQLGCLWHCSHVDGNFCVFAVCVAGLCGAWQAEQLVLEA